MSGKNDDTTGIPVKKPRQIRTELDRLLMDEGTVNMLCDREDKLNNEHSSKKAKLEALHLKRLQVLSSVRNRSSGESVKKLREKKKPELKISRRRSAEESSYSNGNSKKGVIGSWFKGRRASLLATLKQERLTNGNESNTSKNEYNEGTTMQKRILWSASPDGLGHITITFPANGRWTIDLQGLKDLTSTLEQLEQDPNVKLILVSSSGSKFCNGIDLRELLTGDRNKAAEEIAEAINNYLSTLYQMKKLIIISIHSSVSNLFVSSLPLYDLVYASDKSTFRCNYLKLNQVPEAGTLLSETIGKSSFSNLIYGKGILTASEAKDAGLVTEVLWPARYQEEVVLRVRSLLKSNLSSVSAIKSSIRNCSALSESSLEQNKKSLVNSWTSEEFQVAARKFVNAREFY